MTDAGGDCSFSIALPIAADLAISATASSIFNGTSEISPAVETITDAVFRDRFGGKTVGCY